MMSARDIKNLMFFLVFVCCLLASVKTKAQETQAFEDPEKSYFLGMEAYEAGLYGLSVIHLSRYIKQPLTADRVKQGLFLREAELTRALAELKLDKPEAEDQLYGFVDAHKPDPLATEAALEIADLYFTDRHFQKAIDAYSRIARRTMTKQELNKLHFNKGYSHFVLKEFDEAEAELAPIIDLKTQYYYPANYYYGMCAFFKKDYARAEKSFEKAAGSDKYKPYIPYYLSQMYFAQKQYDKLIGYGERSLKTNPENAVEIRHLIGQAYFEKGDYQAALPHLRLHEEKTAKMPAADFYQLGYAEMKAGNYNEAIGSFLVISGSDTALGMLANFYLAQCYLSIDDKYSARNAFGTTSRMNYYPVIAEEALFHFGRLSAELNYDYDAIAALDRVPITSKYYPEAQDALAGVFVNTRDFAGSIARLEEKDNLSTSLKKAYQEVTLYYGLQLYNDGQLQMAEQSLDKSLIHTLDAQLKAQSLFWKAEIAHRNNQFDKSIDLFHQYFTVARAVGSLPAESSQALASYTQGYNYTQKSDYISAESAFIESIKGLETESKLQGRNYYQQRILPDAILRAADCQFKRNKYADALKMYRKSSAGKLFGFQYALYQEAIIMGLQGNAIDKIVILDELAKNHPQSEFADDALFQMGITYLEINRGEKAIPQLEKLVAQYENSPLRNSALLRLGLISYNNGDLNAAIDYYKQVLRSNPSQLEIKDALAALEEIYVHDLSEPQPYFALLESMPGYNVSNLRKDSISFRTAEIQYEEGKYSRAVEEFNEYLRNFPKGVYRLTALYQRGESYSVLKNYEAALADYSSLVEAGNNPYFIDALEKAAIISYNHTQNFNKALEYYKRLVSSSKEEKRTFEAKLGLIRSAFRAGNKNDVLTTLETLEKDSRLTPENIAEIHYYGMKIRMENKAIAEAIRHANLVIKHSNNILAAEARYLVAKAYFEQGQIELAEQLCHIANKENANYPRWVAKSLILLSDIHVSRKDYFNAKAPLEAIIEHFTQDPEMVIEARDKLNLIRALEDQTNRIQTDTGKTLPLDYSNDQK